MRPDGTRVRDLTAIMQALPYVMPKRYDAQNWAEENLDEDAIRDYIRAKRREGRSVTHMSLLVSAYYRAVLKNPKINYFVMNRRIYKRNHFCFSFVILKTRADGTPDETSLKVYLEPEDTVFTVTEKTAPPSRRTRTFSTITTPTGLRNSYSACRVWPGRSLHWRAFWTGMICCPGLSLN